MPVIARRILLALCVLAVGHSGARGDGGETISCPAEIAAPRPDLSPPQGWTAIWEKRSHHRLRGIDVTRGDIASITFLAPRQRHVGRRVFSTWDLQSDADDPVRIRLYCRYSGTPVMLTRELPRTITTCRATWMADDEDVLDPRSPVTLTCR